MLSHKVLKAVDSGNLADYYGDGADDYYAKEGEAQVWQGKGAEALDLTGEVGRLRFQDLLHGRVTANRSIRNTTRKDSADRLGIDLTFSAPKSISIQALVGGDPALIHAHDLAVTRVLERVEAMAAARTKVDGVVGLERTGNLVMAKFRHETTREQDPQLHTHAIVMNITQRADGTWRALHNDEIVKSTKWLGALYQSELAAELERQGYKLRLTRDGFELANITDAQITAFSQRSARIEERLAEQGLTRETATAAERQKAALDTRKKKDAEVDRATLFDGWTKRARDLGVSYAEPDPTSAGPSGARAGPEMAEHAADEAAKRAVKYAVNHLTEREAVITKRALVATALRNAVGSTTLDHVEAAIEAQIASRALVAEETLYALSSGLKKTGYTREEWIAAAEKSGSSAKAAPGQVDADIASGALVAIETRYATAAAIGRETSALAVEREGRGAVAPMMTAEEAGHYFGATSLNDGQRGAASLILTTPNRVVGVEGLAGTGKSHTLDIVNGALEQQGYKMIALAPYAAQVRALRELGVQGRTVAAFLKAKDKGLNERSVIVIDEAGVMPANDMARILKLAKKANARVVAVGDREQTKAIQAGRPFDQLIHAGMSLARMTEIQRQKDPQLKRAVEHAAAGQMRDALENVRSIVQIKSDGARRARIAADYVALSPEQRDRTLIVSGTNIARREINAHVRQQLELSGSGKVYRLLLRRDTTQEERRHARNYGPGDVIQPEQDHASGLKRHEIYDVVGHEGRDKLVVRAPNGDVVTFDPKDAVLSVYDPEMAELSPGDRVKITRNDALKDLDNGQRFTVKALRDDQVVLSDGRRDVTLPSAKGLHVDLAYTSTVASSQGLTEDFCFMDIETKSRTTASDAFYVALSRARYDAPVYTDDKAMLPAAISRRNEKTAALDIQRTGAVPDYGLAKSPAPSSGPKRATPELGA